MPTADQHDHRKVIRFAVSHDPFHTVQGHLDPECSRRRVQPPVAEQGLRGDGAVFRDLLSWRLKHHYGAARRDGDDTLLADLQGLVETFRPHGFHDRHDDAGKAVVHSGFPPVWSSARSERRKTGWERRPRSASSSLRRHGHGNSPVPTRRTLRARS